MNDFSGYLNLLWPPKILGHKRLVKTEPVHPGLAKRLIDNVLLRRQGCFLNVIKKETVFAFPLVSSMKISLGMWRPQHCQE